LYSFESDLILDPFMGAGSTALAALEAGRHYVGYEIDSDYARLAQERLSEARG
jgi:site-specific DNA-methyltransferase (adenine-specific)